MVFLRMSLSAEEAKNLIGGMRHAAIAAGSEILKIYELNTSVTELKADNSPLTTADKKSNEVITNFLSSRYKYPIISEENNIRETTDKYYFLIDPLDGTKEFIKRNGEFTVNIALIDVVSGEPLLGVVNAPCLGELFIGDNINNLATKYINEKPYVITVRSEYKVPTVVVSRSHRTPEIDNFLRQFEKYHELSVGSSLKICMVADGRAQFYPRLGPTYIWDTAAAHAVLSAAGGNMYEYGSRNELRYNLIELKNPYFLAAATELNQ